jgi:hypothetical protein
LLLYTDINSLVDYYIRQGGRGEYQDVFGPVYVGRSYVQRVHSIGSILASLFRGVKLLALVCVKGVRIRHPETKIKVVVADRLAESAQRQVAKLKGSRRKRKAKTSSPSPSQKKGKARVEKKPSTKKKKIIRGDLFS